MDFMMSDAVWKSLFFGPGFLPDPFAPEPPLFAGVTLSRSLDEDDDVELKEGKSSSASAYLLMANVVLEAGTLTCFACWTVTFSRD